LLKSLILKFVKNAKSQCGDAAAQHLVCVRAFCVERYAGLQSGIPLHPERFTFLTNFKISDFNKCSVLGGSVFTGLPSKAG